MADTPITREEKYLAYLTGDYKADIPKPITRQERYLYELCLKGMGGEISPEEIQKAVNEYLEKNPVKPGATTEQAQQIEQNKTDIASLKTETSSLKEDLSTKITKFYASNQGETHLADSDNSKIMDMMIYGKSEQKQYSGKNLLNATLQTTTNNGVTCTANGDGTYTLNGTASENASFMVYDASTPSDFEYGKTYKLIGCPNNGDYSKYYILLNYWDAPPVFDVGNGATKQYTSGKKGVRSDICVSKGTTVNNLLFKPMIVDASLYPDTTYDDFEPYTGGIPSPNPDYPQEINSVVNPTVKVCGKNLWDNFKTLSSGNVEQKNGTYIATTDTMRVDVTPSSDGSRPLLLKANNTYTFSLKTTVSTSGNRYVCLRYTNGEIKNISFINNNFINFVPERDVEKIGFILYGSVAGDKVYDVQLEMGSEATPYEPYHEQTVTLPYTLNAIPVNSGGNVTIDGQQYIADYVDVERGKLVNMVDSSKLDNTQSIVNKTEWLLAKPQEIGLTQEEVQAFKTFVTYYPTTNISVNSEQLDGYTVFNYPISMANGWNYVKKQLNDNRDYIYDMDMQSAEAYVNSEYAVALTELEV